jgi:hypothetical protein
MAASRKVTPLSSPAQVSVIRLDVENLGETEELLEGIATVLDYAGHAGQHGGEAGADAAWTALGLSHAVRLAQGQIAAFRQRSTRREA